MKAECNCCSKKIAKDSKYICRECKDCLNEEEKKVKRNICYHCGSDKVLWQADFDFEDYGYEGDGIVRTYRCDSCGADIEYTIVNRGENNE